MKIIKVEGMNCSRCQARIEEAVKKVEGVKSVKTDLKNKEVKVKGEVTSEVLQTVITETGYKVVSIAEKKGLFN